MKKELLLSLGLGVVAFTTQIHPTYANDIRFQPAQVKILPEKTFIPAGFDNNDNSQIVISGNLPDTCHKAGSVNVAVDQLNRKIYFHHSAYVYRGGKCLQVLVPYTQTINLGIVPSGQYQIIAMDQQSQPHYQGTISIGISATAAPDDYLYAPVQDVYLNSSPTSNSPTLVLKGNFGQDCMDFQETKVLYRTENVIEILPIASAKENANCKPSPHPFEVSVALNSPWKGQTLVYVRSLNGQSIAKVIDIE